MQRIALIGVGLIVGSLARALKASPEAENIHLCGYFRSSAAVAQALEIGITDSATTSLAEAVAGADVVILGVPVGAIGDLLQQLKPYLGAAVVISDVGSTKGSVVAAAEAVFGQLPPRFIPGHPIAGTEKSGMSAALPDLFQQRRVILTPNERSDRQAVGIIRHLWQLCGAEVVEMPVVRHDEVLAATSHLPHMLAYTLVDTLARLDEHDDIFRFAAGGFRDFTRIASSNPQMWHDICLNNRPALLKILQHFGHELARLAAAIEQGDGATLLRIFADAKMARDNYSANH
ncbi:MAG: prephenate dehydrogenase/arogenate dehydrogenase family protein [Gammaproteobacteria bacterium]|nr:prephenate dehydrogenase/arogenate dehydrogenase family protein [Gammaproteobacteria bacterium]